MASQKTIGALKSSWENERVMSWDAEERENFRAVPSETISASPWEDEGPIGLPWRAGGA